MYHAKEELLRAPAVHFLVVLDTLTWKGVWHKESADLLMGIPGVTLSRGLTMDHTYP